MQFQEFNEKCDVYSYGIVLWEILTREEPFGQYTSFSEFKEAVCIRGERPTIPEDCPGSLKDLIVNCWNKEPSLRPSFKEIINKLDYVIVDSAIPTDFHGKKFWGANFLKKVSVGKNFG